MFTGIVQHVGVLTNLRATSAGKRLSIDLGPLSAGLKLGGSIAVNGACLTAVELAGPVGQFDVVAETLSRTTLDALRPGASVNLERPLEAGDPLDGHLVQGHVDATAVVRAIRRQGAGQVWQFAAPAELVGELVPKGSVAVDGVSLTLVDVGPDNFTVALIPTTLARTTLGGLTVGRRVNVETDVIGKYVRRYVGRIVSGEGLTLEKLKEAGLVE